MTDPTSSNTTLHPAITGLLAALKTGEPRVHKGITCPNRRRAVAAHGWSSEQKNRWRLRGGPPPWPVPQSMRPFPLVFTPHHPLIAMRAGVANISLLGNPSASKRKEPNSLARFNMRRALELILN